MNPQPLPARLLASSVALAATLCAQGTFSAGQEITTTCYAAKDTHAADLDGDGALDVLSVSWQDHRVAWYRNLGNGTFGSEQVITTSATGAEAAYAADLDGDGDLDVLVAAGGSHVVSYFPNLGNGSFGAEQVLSSSPTGPQDVYAADLDGDGDLDVLAAYYFGYTVAWFENLGGGSFDTPQVISATSGRLHSVRAGDLDDDGDVDVVAASVTGNKVVMFENQGAGAFASEQVLAPAVSPRCVRLGDLDNDGDLDVLYTATFAGNIGMGVAWVQNEGSNTFASAQIISADTVYPYGCGAADLDGDGDLDVLSASTNDDKVAYYENLGAGAFGSQQVLSDTAGGARAVEAADLDGDGDLDVLSAAGADHTIAWFENHRGVEVGSGCNGLNLTSNVPTIGGSWDLLLEGMPQSSQLAIFLLGDSAAQAPAPVSTGVGLGAETTITTPSTGHSQSELLDTADFDGDGDVDLLILAGDLSWCENLGQGSYAAPQVIPTTYAGSTYGVSSSYDHDAASAGDIDGDGLPDVLWKVYGSVFWNRNLGAGVFGPAQLVAQRTGPNPLSPAGPLLFDADGDGDLDVAFHWTNEAPGSVTNDLCWCENLGGSFGPYQTIANQIHFAWDLEAADLDGDGDQDLAATGAPLNMGTTTWKCVMWFENDGSGTFGPQQNVGEFLQEGISVTFEAADLNGDGAEDLVFYTHEEPAGAHWFFGYQWMENLGGGTFAPRQRIAWSFDTATTVADFDGDGDADVLASNGFGAPTSPGGLPAYSNTGTAWWENDGSGTFSSLKILKQACWQVAVADCDGDGAPDLISRNAQPNPTSGSLQSYLAWQPLQAVACTLQVNYGHFAVAPAIAGQSTYSMPVPNDPGLVGLTIAAQAVAPNGAQLAIQNLGLSNSIEFEVIQ